MEKPNIFKIEKGEASLEQYDKNVHHLFDIPGFVHHEFIPETQTVNGQFYCNVLRCLREDIYKKKDLNCALKTI